MVDIRNRLLIVMMLIIAIPAFAATLESKADRQVMDSGETLELTVSLDKQVLFGEPDFSTLENDFEIINRNRQSRISIVNGKKLSYTQWVLTLSPKRQGTLIIPSFNFKDEVSDALEISVRKPSAMINRSAPIFTEATLEKNSVYVQEQVLLTLRLYTTLSLSNYSMSEIIIPDTQTIKLSENQYQKQLDGKDYIVVETRWAIFADKNGELQIPSVRYGGVASQRNRSSGNSWFNRSGKRVTVNTEEKTLTVKPRPIQANSHEWLPARQVKLYDRWTEKKPVLTVGEPVTRTITLSAEGLTAAQLPPLPLGNSDSFKIYNDQPQLEDNTDIGGITGNRIESMAIVPTQPGPLTLPEVRVQWWDTEAGQVREAVLASQTFKVLASANAGADTGHSSLDPATTSTATGQTNSVTDGAAMPAEDKTGWLVTALAISNGVLVLIAITFAILWWRSRPASHNGIATTSEALIPNNKLFKNIRVASASKNYAALREAIIQWARDHWHDPHLHTLDQLASRTDDETLKRIFQQLDACLYNKQGGEGTQPDVNTLVELLEKIHQMPIDRKTSKARQLLPLYPESPAQQT